MRHTFSFLSEACLLRLREASAKQGRQAGRKGLTSAMKKMTS